MKIFNSIVIFFYTLVFLAVGGIIISYSLGIITVDTINELIKYLPTELNLRMIIGFAGIAIIVISLSILHLALGQFRQEKTLAYDHPGGRVTVALSAIEDLIKRLSKDFEEVKELRPAASINRDGIQISCKTILFQGAAIPNITQKIQSTIKLNIQNLLGIEEDIHVGVYVVKILPKETVTKEEIPKAPFQYKSEV